MPDATISASKERDWVMELIYEEAEKLAMKDNPLHGWFWKRNYDGAPAINHEHSHQAWDMEYE